MHAERSGGRGRPTSCTALSICFRTHARRAITGKGGWGRDDKEEEKEEDASGQRGKKKEDSQCCQVLPKGKCRTFPLKNGVMQLDRMKINRT